MKIKSHLLKINHASMKKTGKNIDLELIKNKSKPR